MVTQARARFPSLNACSFDKGFHALEQSAEFVKARRAHSAVESSINGLDMCPDHGIDGYKRYVALAVVARNIRRIGDILWEQEQERLHRLTRLAGRAPPLKKAA